MAKKRMKKILKKLLTTDDDGMVAMLVLTLGASIFLATALYSFGRTAATVATTSAGTRVDMHNLTTSIQGALAGSTYCTLQLRNGLGAFAAMPSASPIPIFSSVYPALPAGQPLQLGLLSLGPLQASSTPVQWNNVSLEPYTSPSSDGIQIVVPQGLTPAQDPSPAPSALQCPPGSGTPCCQAGTSLFCVDGAYLKFHVHRQMGSNSSVPNGTFQGQDSYYVQSLPFNHYASPNPRPLVIDVQQSGTPQIVYCNL